jgi:hypothetical protein
MQEVKQYSAYPYVVFECVPEHLSCGLWHTGNMDISGEVPCHIPNSNAFANFLSENKPCHIYNKNEILMQPFQVLADW